jgi:uncharacterized repeat protein (TIGR01451 family)
MDFGVSFCARRVCGGKSRNIMKTLGFTFTVFVCMLALAGSTPLLAQSPSFPDFSSNANLTTNGTAVVPTFNGSVNVLRLNPDLQSQAGSAWFNVKQPVATGFTTTFTFQITPSGFPADGLAFVIQNAPPPLEGPNTGGLNALGQGGGAIGYDGIPNSLAVEFDTYQNAGPGPNNDPNANHVGVQSCGTNPNSADHHATYNVGESFVSCNLGLNSNLFLPNENYDNLSDGTQHTATVDYIPPAPNCPSCLGVLNVSLDGINLFPDGIPLNLATLLNLDNGTAWVGFTGATGSYSEINDILSWTFTSHGTESISLHVPAGVFTPFIFGSHLYKVRTDKDIDTLTVTAVPTDPATFLADRNQLQDFPSQCIVYDHTGGKCIEYHAECQGANCNSVNYDVVTSYDVPAGTVITGPAFLKATGKQCEKGIRFDQNIITAFFQTRIDPTTKGSSKPSFSCFAATQGLTYGPADIDVLNLGPLKAKPGSLISYVATVTDFGPSTGQGVTINNTIPTNTTYKSASLCTLSGGCSSMPCSFDGITASCSTPTLAKFGLEFMIVTVRVNATSGKILDTVNVTSFNPDPDVTPDRSSTAVSTISTR